MGRRADVGARPRLEYTAIALGNLESEAWDQFAHRCGAGLRSSSSHLRRFRLKGLVGQSLRLWQAHLHEGGHTRQIAQCAVVASRDRVIFYDGLQILPEHRGLWRDVMAGLLAELGPGPFEYGWEWSLEPPQEDLLETLPGVRIDSVRSLSVHGVDFSCWPDWPSYLTQIRKSVRYEARNAETRTPGLSLVFRRGLASATRIMGLMNARTTVLRRKGVDAGVHQAHDAGRRG